MFYRVSSSQLAIIKENLAFNEKEQCLGDFLPERELEKLHVIFDKCTTYQKKLDYDSINHTMVFATHIHNTTEFKDMFYIYNHHTTQFRHICLFMAERDYLFMLIEELANMNQHHTIKQSVLDFEAYKKFQWLDSLLEKKEQKEEKIKI